MCGARESLELTGWRPWCLASKNVLVAETTAVSTYRLSTKPPSAPSWLADNQYLVLIVSTATVDTYNVDALLRGKSLRIPKAARNERAERSK